MIKIDVRKESKLTEAEARWWRRHRTCHLSAVSEPRQHLSMRVTCADHHSYLLYVREGRGRASDE